ncbi:M3 family metallopeptidase [Umezawaea sp. Da 62-37]|uniref:M3 family metallopeptidase n=1 Tax=Umezawaea sp. Da 62-37 TaxID=3075927 RepID=UPI0028F705A8|nr:M3 family metallopeptidase [Umezawaea sp. Da 62-37]WNV86693.1 M3 family metallopeptidase [Umezawaea sp. Da 62-37]WNV86724.1 M3 family metallopeptidase [Umezawaea sp. Da 62-37]
MFTDVDACALISDLDLITQELGRFRRIYRGILATLAAPELAAAVAEAEQILTPLLEASAYAEARLAADADDETGAEVLDHCERLWSRVASTWDFFEPELARSRAEDASHATELDRHRNYLARLRASATFQPAEPVASVMAGLDPVPAWETLARQMLARIRPGGEPLGAVLPALYAPDVEFRRRRADDVSSALLAEVDLRASVLGGLAQARAARAEVSGARDWAHAERVANQVDDRDLAALLETVRGSLGTVHRYYSWKRTALGHPLSDSDRYAPLPGSPGGHSWELTREVVLEAFRRIGGRVADVAAELLDSGAVDAFPRQRKTRGALTFGLPSGRVAVLLNFTGVQRDVLTLAHELGHAAHLRLAVGRGAFTATAPTVLGETVALFTESVAADVLAERADDATARVALTARTVEDRLVAVFRQVVLHDFEDWLHTAGGRSERLDAESLAERWIEGQRRLYGDAIQLTDGYRHWWSYLDELFLRPGGRFAYPYGQLAAMALAARFRETPSSFRPRFESLLSAGASAPPAELLGELGVHPDDPCSWQEGVDALIAQVDALRADRPDKRSDDRLSPSFTRAEHNQEVITP